MNRIRRQRIKPQNTSIDPDGDLFIYYLKGRLKTEERVITVQGKAEDFIAYPADLIIANIHYDVMRHLIQAKGFLDKKRFILSGLLRSEAKDIADSLARHPVKIIKQWTHDGVSN